MASETRRRLSGLLVVLGAVALLLSLPMQYLERNVFDARGFADNAANAVQNDAVRQKLAGELTDRLVARDPRLVSVAPVLGGLTSSLLDTGQARAILRAAAVETHNAVFSQTKGSVVIDLANVGVIALELLQARDPKLEPRLAQSRDLAIKLADRTLTVRAVRAAERVRVLAVVLRLLALALFAAALWISPWRRRAALNLGVALVTVGALSFVAWLVLRTAVLAGRAGESRDVAAGVLDAFLGAFPLWCGAVALAGVIVAGSAASLMRDLDPARIPQLLWARITRRPEGTWAQVLGALALIVLGAAVIGDPLGAVRLVTGLIAAWMIFAGVVTLLRLLVGGREEDRDGMTARALGRRYAPWVAGGLIGVALTALGVGLLLDRHTTPAPKVSTDPGCNGDVALCARRFDEVVFATSHNAMANAQDRFLNANHGIAVSAQLDLGIRGLLLDAYLGQRNDQGVVRTDLAPKAVDAVEAKIGPQGLAAAQRLAGSVAFGPVAGPKKLYLCHIICEFGATEASKGFAQIRDWLDLHPREVLMITIEDAAPTAEIKRGLEDAGLAAMASDFQPRAGTPFPTLEEMIASGKRLWIQAEERGIPGSWYHRAYDVMQETPFSFTKPAQLQTDASCRPQRGGTTPPLFLVNSWVETYPPNPRNADVVNQPRFLVDRARRCARLRDRVPNFLAVDFVERGDVVGAAAVLNGLATLPAPAGGPG